MALLELTLAARATAMTLGRGRIGALNLLLPCGAAVGVGLFVRVQATAASPMIRIAALRDPVLRAGLAMSALVSTVMMATLVCRALPLTSQRWGWFPRRDRRSLR